MVRALLEALPTWAILVIAIVGAVAFGVVGLRVFQRRFPQFGVRGEALLGLDVFHSVCALMFALLLGLVIVNGYDDMKATDEIVRTEATSLAQFYRDTRGLSGIADGIEADVAEYTRAVVEVEWETMGDGEQSPAVDAAIDSMFASMLSYRPADEAEDVAFREAFGVLNDLVAARRDRLAAAASRVPAPLEVFLVVGGFLLIALSWLFCQVGDRRHELMVAGFATLVAFSVVLALVLAYPFAGDVRVEAEPFRLAVLSRFWP